MKRKYLIVIYILMVILIPDFKDNNQSTETENKEMIDNIEIVEKLDYNKLIESYENIKEHTFFNFGNGKNNLWVVMKNDVSSRQLVLINKDVVNVMQYERVDKNKSYTWNNSNIREWLNNDYYETQFSDFDRSCIVKADIKINEELIEDNIYIPRNRDFGIFNPIKNYFMYPADNNYEYLLDFSEKGGATYVQSEENEQFISFPNDDEYGVRPMLVYSYDFKREDIHLISRNEKLEKYTLAKTYILNGEFDEAEFLLKDVGDYKDAKYLLNTLNYSRYDLHDKVTVDGKEWVVLNNDRKSRHLELMSMNFVKNMKYKKINPKGKYVWENSNLREWLNSDYYSQLGDDLKIKLVKKEIKKATSMTEPDGYVYDKIYLPQTTDIAACCFGNQRSNTGKYAECCILGNGWTRDSAHSAFEKPHGFFAKFFDENGFGHTNNPDNKLGLRPCITIKY